VILAVLQARMSSSRLPGKVMAPLAVLAMRSSRPDNSVAMVGW